MPYETVEMIVADRARLRAEVERLKKERDAEREVGRVYHDLAERLKRKADDSRRTAMEEAKREYLRGVGDGAYLLPKVVAHVRATYPNWPEADWTAEAIDAMQPGSNSSEAWFVEKLLAEEAAIRAAAKEER